MPLFLIPLLISEHLEKETIRYGIYWSLIHGGIFHSTIEADKIETVHRSENNMGVLHFSLKLCSYGNYSRASVGNGDLAGRRNEMLQKDKVKLRSSYNGAKLRVTYSRFDASGSRKSRIAHQPHVSLRCGTTPLPVKVSM
jgi:hypothetical protein